MTREWTSVETDASVPRVDWSHWWAMRWMMSKGIGYDNDDGLDQHQISWKYEEERYKLYFPCPLLPPSLHSFPNYP